MVAVVGLRTDYLLRDYLDRSVATEFRPPTLSCSALPSPSYAAARAALPSALARELGMTGRVLGADEAHARGVVSSLGSLEDTLALAAQIASAPWPAVREIKRRVLLEAEST